MTFFARKCCNKETKLSLQQNCNVLLRDKHETRNSDGKLCTKNSFNIVKGDEKSIIKKLNK